MTVNVIAIVTDLYKTTNTFTIEMNLRLLITSCGHETEDNETENLNKTADEAMNWLNKLKQVGFFLNKRLVNFSILRHYRPYLSSASFNTLKKLVCPKLAQFAIRTLNTHIFTNSAWSNKNMKHQ